MTTSLPFTLTFLSDYHIGTGTSVHGGVDAKLYTDIDGMPLIGGKTVTGVLRDGAEQLAIGLDGLIRFASDATGGSHDPAAATGGNTSGDDGHDEHQGPVWCQWVDYLFGTQPNQDGQRLSGIRTGPLRPAAIGIRPSRLHHDLVDALRERPAVARALRFGRSQTALDEGMARRGSLRTIEMGRSHMVFHGVVEAPDDLPPEGKALLEASILWMEQMGGSRTRGPGLFELRLDEWGDQSVADLVDEVLSPILGRATNEVPEPPKWVPPADLPPDALFHDQADTDTGNEQGWLVLELDIRVVEPLVVAARRLGNRIISSDQIPGSMLLPLVQDRWDRSLGSLIEAGALVVTDGVPAGPAGHAARPVPRSLRVEKGSEGFGQRTDTVHNALSASSLNDGEEATPNERHPRGWLSWPTNDQGQGRPQHHTVRTQVEVRNATDDQYGAPTDRVGGVYVYEAIAPGQLFRAEVRLRSSAVAAQGLTPDQLVARLQGTVTVGRSKKDDFGLVDVECRLRTTPPSSPGSIAGAGLSSARSTEAPQRFTAWMLSDLVLVDQRLRPTTSPDALAAELTRRLGVATTVHQPYLWEQRRDSWHRGWNLPRPTLATIGPGSCFIVDVTPGTVSISQLQELEQTGIGLRCAEGFGQVALADPFLDQTDWPGWPDDASANDSTNIDDSTNNTDEVVAPSKFLSSDHPEATWIANAERAAWRRAIRSTVGDLASDPKRLATATGLGTAKPSASQQGTLRAILERLDQPGGPTVLGEWLVGINKRERSDELKRKWNDATLKNLRHLTGPWPDDSRGSDNSDDHHSQIWTVLDLPEEHLTVTRAAAARRRRELWPVAVQRVVRAWMEDRA